MRALLWVTVFHNSEKDRGIAIEVDMLLVGIGSRDGVSLSIESAHLLRLLVGRGRDTIHFPELKIFAVDTSLSSLCCDDDLNLWEGHRFLV